MKPSRADVDRMAGVVSAALYAPGGVRDLVANDPRRAALMDQTTIVVQAEPTDYDYELGGTSVDQHLLGLWTYPPNRIQLFYSEIVVTGYDPVDVATHELGHVWGFDHGAHCPSCSEKPANPRPYVHMSGCPVCELHDHTAVAMGLMDGLRMRAMLEHVIPAGLGGTIPEAQWRIRQAKACVPKAAPTVADPAAIQYLSQALDQADRALSGWLEPDDVTRAYIATRIAWDAAYDANFICWSRKAVG